MEDKELLRLAAKAAGYPIHSDAKWVGAGGGKPSLYMGERGPKWNPLEDDGDALRLAVILDIGVTSKKDHQYEKNTSVAVFNQGNARITEKHKDHSNDAGKATRHVIVRAAAEIGRGMK